MQAEDAAAGTEGQTSAQPRPSRNTQTVTHTPARQVYEERVCLSFAPCVPVEQEVRGAGGCILPQGQRLSLSSASRSSDGWE